MANFNWRITSGDFGLAADWINTSTNTNPATTPPGSADTVNFNTTGGTITGTGLVDTLNINQGASAAWLLNGQITTGWAFINAATTIGPTGKVTLLGKNPGTFFPSGGQINVPVTLNGGVLDSSGAQFAIGPGYGLVHDGSASFSIINGGKATALGATIGQGSGGALSVSGAGSTWSSIVNATLDTATLHSGYLTVGQQATANSVTTAGTGTLTVSNGGMVNAAGGFTLGLDAGSTGTATVSSGGSITVSGRSANVGNGAGSTGTLTINAGSSFSSTVAGQLANYEFNIGVSGASGSTTAATGMVTVQGAGALLDIGANGGSVGLSGTGTLNVLAGAVAKFSTIDNVNGTASLAIGREGTGTVLVSGTGSTLSLGGGMYAGRGLGSAGTVTVTAGGTLTQAALAVNEVTDGNSFGNSGTSTGSLIYGGTGTLNVTAGGKATFASQISFGLSGSTGVGLVSDAGSVLTLQSGLTIGSGTVVTGGTGTLTVQSGGVVQMTAAADATRNYLVVGGAVGTTGAVTVTGSGSLLDVGLNAASIGNTGTGSLTVSAGATARSATADGYSLSALSVGNVAGSVGAVTVTGAGSSYVVAGNVYVGRGGSGALVVDQGGSFGGGKIASGDGLGAHAAFGISIGDGTPLINIETGVPNTTFNFGGSGSATVKNGSTLTSLGAIRVGRRGTTGTLLVDTGSTVQAASTIYAGSDTDRTGGNGAIIVKGGSTLKSTGPHTLATASVQLGADTGTTGAMTISDSGSTLDAGGDRITIAGGGTGTLTIGIGGTARAGASYADTEAALAVGAGIGGQGSVAVSGGKLLASGLAVLGGNNTGSGLIAGGVGTLNVTTGGLFRAANLASFSGSALSVDGSSIAVIGSSAGTAGVLTIDSGATLSGAGQINAAVFDNGTVTARGGTLSINAVVGGGTGTLGASGGTLDVSTSANQAFVFSGNSATIRLRTVTGNSVVSSFAAGDLLDFAGSSATLAGNVLTVGSATYTFTGIAPATVLTLKADGAGGTEVLGTDPLFDASYYLAQNQDVAAAGIDPYQHYLGSGWKEGRNPSALFNTNYYLSHNADVAAAGVNPLLQFAGSGWKEGRDPSALFSVRDYLAANPDIKAAGLDALLHYVSSGRAEGRAAFAAPAGGYDPGVDAAYYYSHNPDVRGAGIDAGAHYNASGWKEGRNPSGYFDTNYYLAQNPDVKAAGVDPLAHFEASGWKEGRQPSLVFDDARYLAAYPDIKAAGLDPLLHYVAGGQAEGRLSFLTGSTLAADPLVNAAYYDQQLGATLIPAGAAGAQQAAWSYDAGGWQKGLNPDAYFNTGYYLSHNPDVAAAHVDPLLHYEASGWKEGRDPSAQFSTNKYLAAYSDVKAAGVDPLLHFVASGQAEGRTAFAV